MFLQFPIGELEIWSFQRLLEANATRKLKMCAVGVLVLTVLCSITVPQGNSSRSVKKVTPAHCLCLNTALESEDGHNTWWKRHHTWVSFLTSWVCWTAPSVSLALHEGALPCWATGGRRGCPSFSSFWGEEHFYIGGKILQAPFLSQTL